MKVTLRLLGTEVLALEVRTRRPVPLTATAGDPVVVQDFSDTAGDGPDGDRDDSRVPFGFATPVLLPGPSIDEAFPDDEEDRAPCRKARTPIGFSLGS